MNIVDYVSYFHDGFNIISIQATQNAIVIIMERAKIVEADWQNAIVLINQNTLKGRLHLAIPIAIWLNRRACRAKAMTM